MQDKLLAIIEEAIKNELGESTETQGEKSSVATDEATESEHSTKQSFPQEACNKLGNPSTASSHLLLFTSALVPKALASILTSLVLVTAQHVIGFVYFNSLVIFTRQNFVHASAF